MLASLHARRCMGVEMLILRAVWMVAMGSSTVSASDDEQESSEDVGIGEEEEEEEEQDDAEAAAAAAAAAVSATGGVISLQHGLLAGLMEAVTELLEPNWKSLARSATLTEPSMDLRLAGDLACMVGVVLEVAEEGKDEM